MNKRFETVCPIISNNQIGGGYFELKIFAPKIAPHCAPGQFFMLKVPDVFLRRPLSIYDADKDSITFLYKVVGKGTEVLSELNSEIGILGPLGNGYKLRGENIFPLAIAGGTGIASLHFLIKTVIKKFSRHGILFYGAKSKKDLICADEIEDLGWDVLRATEDGSAGYKGFVTDAIKNTPINMYDPDKTMVYICGPDPMTKAILEMIRRTDFRGQASLEERMACGLSICQGCAVKIKGEYKAVCKDGPVFEIEDML